MRRIRRALVGTGVGLGLGVGVAQAAEELGTFRWQLSPFCNVVTLVVLQEGAPAAPAFALAGFDDNCGGLHSAAFGTASLSPNGTAALGLTIVTEGGPAQHVDVVLNLGTLSGPWA